MSPFDEIIKKHKEILKENKRNTIVFIINRLKTEQNLLTELIMVKEALIYKDDDLFIEDFTIFIDYKYYIEVCQSDEDRTCLCLFLKKFSLFDRFINKHF